MTQTQLDPEIREITRKIEKLIGKQVLSVQECANYCKSKTSFIYDAIKRGEIKAAGKRNMRITSVSLAKWLTGQNA